MNPTIEQEECGAVFRVDGAIVCIFPEMPVEHGRRVDGGNMWFTAFWYGDLEPAIDMDLGPAVEVRVSEIMAQINHVCREAA